MAFEVSVIHLRVPFLIGLDVLRKLKVILEFGTGHMRDTKGTWHLAFTYLRSHASIQVPSISSVFWTREELYKLHLHFCHPSSVKFYKLQRKTRPAQTPTSVLDTLKRMGHACSTCQE